jgi:hypothetical protein
MAKVKTSKEKLAYIKRWQQYNPEKRRGHHLKERYGITNEKYDDMFLAQDGRCAICGQTEKDGLRLRVDHDHESGFIRGLLCHTCNCGIGMFQEKLDLLIKAVSYLQENK